MSGMGGRNEGEAVRTSCSGDIPRSRSAWEAFHSPRTVKDVAGGCARAGRELLKNQEDFWPLVLMESSRKIVAMVIPG